MFVSKGDECVGECASVYPRASGFYASRVCEIRCSACKVVRLLGSLLESNMLYFGPFFTGLMYKSNEKIAPYFVLRAWPLALIRYLGIAWFS